MWLGARSRPAVFRLSCTVETLEILVFGNYAIHNCKTPFSVLKSVQKAQGKLHETWCSVGVCHNSCLIEVSLIFVPTSTMCTEHERSNMCRNIPPRLLLQTLFNLSINIHHQLLVPRHISLNSSR